MGRFLRWIARRRRARRQRWEGLCHCCGLCCYERFRRKGRVVVDFSRPCPQLDTRTNTCTVYERRFSVQPNCAKVRWIHAVADPYMPPDCGYVQRYRPPLARALHRLTFGLWPLGLADRP